MFVRCPVCGRRAPVLALQTEHRHETIVVRGKGRGRGFRSDVENVEGDVAWMTYLTKATWIQLERLKASARAAGVNVEAIAEEVARTMKLPRQVRPEPTPAPQDRPTQPAKKTVSPKARNGRTIFDAFSDEPIPPPALPQTQVRSLIERNKREIIRRPSLFAFLGSKPPATSVFERARKYKPL